jgi:chromosomal replication initiation ATPase DnaA
VADVLEAVTYVAGVDPLTEGRSTRVADARLLAVHALREITKCSTPEIARALLYSDHSTPLKRLSTPVDKKSLQAVRTEVVHMLREEGRVGA